MSRSLMHLWHDAVYKLHPADPFHGISNKNLLECHHIYTRRDSLFRHDPLNGIPLVAPIYEMQVKHNMGIDKVFGHRWADGNRAKIMGAISKGQRQYLEELAKYTKKDFLHLTNMSEEDFNGKEMACLLDVKYRSWSSDLLYWKLEALEVLIA